MLLLYYIIFCFSFNYNNGMRHIIYNNKQRILKLYHEGISPTFLSKEYHVPQSTLYYWVKKYPQKIGTQNGASLKRWDKIITHNKKIEAELSFLKRTVVKEFSLRERLNIIDKEYGKESVHVQCEALDVSRGTYLNHKYRNKKDNAWFKRREAECEELITKIFEESGRVYGSRKIAAIMQEQGKHVSSGYVKRLMIKNGLISVWNTSYKGILVTARQLRKSAHASADFKVDGINQVWVSDTSAISVHGRYYYVCVYIDLFSRRVVGWNVGKNNSTQLVKRTFIEAYKDRNNPQALIVHTDNGVCYTSYSFNRLLQKFKLAHSYSRIGIPHDNAVAESFFNIMKREGIFLDGAPRSYKELEDRLISFIERYNTSRPHEHLSYISPNSFEIKHQN